MEMETGKNKFRRKRIIEKNNNPFQPGSQAPLSFGTAPIPGSSGKRSLPVSET